MRFRLLVIAALAAAAMPQGMVANGFIAKAWAAPQRPAEFLSSDMVLTWINSEGSSTLRSRPAALTLTLSRGERGL